MQAELYFRLRQLGFEVYGEVKATVKNRGSIFDLVVFWGADAAIIIEVKNTDHKAVLNGKATMQSTKYKEFDLPLIFYTTATPIESVVAKVKQIMNNLIG